MISTKAEQAVATVNETDRHIGEVRKTADRLDSLVRQFKL